MRYELEFLPSAFKEWQKLDKKFKIYTIQIYNYATNPKNLKTISY